VGSHDGESTLDVGDLPGADHDGSATGESEDGGTRHGFITVGDGMIPHLPDHAWELLGLKGDADVVGENVKIQRIGVSSAGDDVDYFGHVVGLML